MHRSNFLLLLVSFFVSLAGVSAHPSPQSSAANAAAAAAVEPIFYKGFDLSSLKDEEDGGAVYRNAQQGNRTEPMVEILAGMNIVRLRLWIDPPIPFEGYYETYNNAYVIALAKRFAKRGMLVYLDLHLSYTWADPNHQFPPSSWPTTLEPLAATLRSYVKDTLTLFSSHGVDLELVSLGNEIRNGILWPVGEVDVNLEPASARVANFTNLAVLLSAARQGVSDAVAEGVHKPTVMIHIDDGWNQTLQATWYESILATGKFTTADWDMFAFSFYPFYGTEATFANLQASLNYLANKYNKPVHVVETDWPNECSGADAPALSEPSIPISAQGQIEWVQGILKVVKAVPNGLGRGVNYWEPTWLNNTGLGSACQSAILFTADWSHYPNVTGYSLPSVDMFKGW